MKHNWKSVIGIVPRVGIRGRASGADLDQHTGPDRGPSEDHAHRLRRTRRSGGVERRVGDDRRQPVVRADPCLEGRRCGLAHRSRRHQRNGCRGGNARCGKGRSTRLDADVSNQSPCRPQGGSDRRARLDGGRGGSCAEQSRLRVRTHPRVKVEAVKMLADLRPIAIQSRRTRQHVRRQLVVAPTTMLTVVLLPDPFGPR